MYIGDKMNNVKSKKTMILQIASVLIIAGTAVYGAVVQHATWEILPFFVLVLIILFE